MIFLKIIPLVIWFVAGIITLSHKAFPITRLEYGLAWGTLLLLLVEDVVIGC